MTDILKLFEGLSPEQAKAYRARIMPALEGLRAEILNPSPPTNGNGNHNTQGAKNMSATPLGALLDSIEDLDDAQREKFFDALPGLVEKVTGVPKPTEDTLRWAQLDKDEDEALRQLQNSSLRGVNFIEARKRIVQRYSEMRAEKLIPSRDPDDPDDARAGGQIEAEYEAMRRQIPRGNLIARKKLREATREKARLAGFHIDFSDEKD